MTNIAQLTCVDTNMKQIDERSSKRRIIFLTICMLEKGWVVSQMKEVDEEQLQREGQKLKRSLEK